MATVFDVARYVLSRRGAMTTMKLQKLVYYAQAWSLAWDAEPIFEEAIEAWDNGPVVRELFEAHRGRYRIDDLPKGSPQSLSAQQCEVIDAVLEHYGGSPPEVLTELTHVEEPWRMGRAAIPPVIPHHAMQSYYRSLPLERLDEAPGNLFYARSLIARVTPANRQPETPMGGPVGREVW